MRTLADRIEHVLTCFLEFSAPFFQSHLLINYRISCSTNLPANRKRDFLSESANGILAALFATPSIKLKKRIGARKNSKNPEKTKTKAPQRLGEVPEGIKNGQVDLQKSRMKWHTLWHTLFLVAFSRLAA